MPYKRGQKWIAQVRKSGMKREKVFQTRKEALNWETKMRRKPVSDWKKKIDTVCLGDWAEKYLDYAQSMFSQETYGEKKSMFALFFENVDPTMPVSKLTRAKVLDYVIKQHDARSGYAANKDRKNLIAAWNWGIKYMEPPLPEPNPCCVDRMPEIRNPRYVPPEDDFWRIYELAEGQDQVMLLTFLHVAARRGEGFRLKLSDLDFSNDRIRLWTRKRAGGNFEYDWLPMTKELKAALLWWLNNRPIKDSPHVFLCLDEKPVSKEYHGEPFRKRLHFMRRLCERAKVKPFGFHAIRHLSASILYKCGYDIRTIQAILRHRSVKTTERYLKSLGLEDVREALEDLSDRRSRVLEFKPKARNEDVEVSTKNKKPSEEPSSPQTARPKLVVVK